MDSVANAMLNVFASCSVSTVTPKSMLQRAFGTPPFFSTEVRLEDVFVHVQLHPENSVLLCVLVNRGTWAHRVGPTRCVMSVCL